MDAGGYKNMSDSLFLNNSIVDIHEALRKKLLQPIDIARECINQVSKDKLKAWASFDPDLLISKFEKIKIINPDRKTMRSLEAIPVGVKDIFNTVEYPTRMGSQLWKNITPGNDARALYNIERVGAVIAGKTVTGEFAVHALGKTLHPYDASRNPGTSSSGSAVAVATGMVPVAVGTQADAGIIRPASYCGIYGCKPSFGLIPRNGMLTTTDSLDTVGFFTVFAKDLRRVFDALRIYGPNYPISHALLNDSARQNKPADRPWKVALVKPHVWKYCDSYAQDSLLRWAKQLDGAPDVEVIELELPEEMNRTHEIHATIYDCCLAYYFEKFELELVSPTIIDLVKHGNEITLDQFITALQEQKSLCCEMDDFFSTCDIFITLSAAGQAPLREETEPPDSALMWTMTHLPVVSAPAFTSPNGLPFGLQIVARRYNDYLLFNFISYLLSQGMLLDRRNIISDNI